MVASDCRGLLWIDTMLCWDCAGERRQLVVGNSVDSWLLLVGITRLLCLGFPSIAEDRIPSNREAKTRISRWHRKPVSGFSSSLLKAGLKGRFDCHSQAWQKKMDWAGGDEMILSSPLGVLDNLDIVRYFITLLRAFPSTLRNILCNED